jgi:hypothetical protein
MSTERGTPTTPRHAIALSALAVGGLLSLTLRGPRWFQPTVSSVVGAATVCVLLHFARQRRSHARAMLARVPSGRISERRDASAHLVFELPGAGIEPWHVDAWVVGVVSVATAFMGLSAEALARPLAFTLVLLMIVLGLRLASVNADHIRLELSDAAWWVQAREGGRSIRRSGFGPLIPELLADALVLWSSEGRVGVLRRELEPEERAWLANRLKQTHGGAPSVPEPARGEVEQPEAGEHGQRE